MLLAFEASPDLAYKHLINILYGWTEGPATHIASHVHVHALEPEELAQSWMGGETYTGPSAWRLMSQ